MSIYYIKPSIDVTLYPEIHKPKNIALDIKPNETIKAQVVDVMPSGRIVVRLNGVYVNMRTEIPLQKDTLLYMRLLPPNNERKDIRFQLLSFEPPQKEIDLARIKDPKLFFALKNLPQKERLLEHLKEQGLYPKLPPNKLQSIASDMLANLQRLTPQALEDFVQKSGLFFEKKLATLASLKDLLSLVKKLQSHDIPKSFFQAVQQGNLQGALLMLHNLIDLKQLRELFPFMQKAKSLQEVQTHLEKQIAKIKKDIKEDMKQHLPNVVQNFQLLSSLIDGIYLYLPLFWEDLEDGTLAIQKRGRGYFFQVDLHFEDIGRVGANAVVDEGDLKLVFFAEEKDFLQFLAQGFEELKKELGKDFRYCFISVGSPVEEKRLLKDSFVDVSI